MSKKALLLGIGSHENPHYLSNLAAPRKDVRAFREILENQKLGGFQQVEDLIDIDASHMQESIESFFKDCKKDDLLLLYFSGHGLRDENGKLYLATRRTKSDVRGDLLKSSAVCADFIHEAVINSPSKRQILILDCCFSGAYRNSLGVKSDNSLELKKFLGAEGSVVLASSGSAQYSFEHKTSELSVYTEYLIQGIKSGQADLDRDGNIVVRELHEYIGNQLRGHYPSLTPKIIVLDDDAYNIPIAHSAHEPSGKKQLDSDVAFSNWDRVKLLENTRNDEELETKSLPNYLEPYGKVIRRLIDSLSEGEKFEFSHYPENIVDVEPEIKQSVLNHIKFACNADFVCTYQVNDEKDAFVYSCSNLDTNFSLDVLCSEVLPQITYKEIFSSYYNGVYKISGGYLFVIIPIRISPKPEFLAMCVSQKGFEYLGEPLGIILSTFYQLPLHALQCSDLAEAALLDSLKKTFGFVSPELYKRRFFLFKSRLKKMIVYFQPIVQLEPIDIVAWEALARDPSDGFRTPVDLFDAAELWGTQFTTELDLHFLKVATNTYQDERKRLKLNRSSEVTPIAINVYPSSLMRKVYFEAVRKIMREDKIIPPNKLILEISEKSALPNPPHWDNDKPELHGFKNQLKEFLRQKIKVRFAIDDFGVGHASLSRLLDLNLDYVKIDREVLYHKNEEVVGRTFEYVSDVLIEAEHHGSAVIVEGVDDSCPVSLAELRSKGVSSIQGFLVDRAVEHIYPRLTPEKAELLRSRLDG